MVEVVRLDARGDEPTEQALEHRRIVVHAPEQHGLPEERDTSFPEPSAGPCK